MAVLKCVSMTQEIANLVKEKNLSPSECFAAGVKALLAEPMPDLPGEKIIHETDKSKLERMRNTMQACIDELSEKVDRLEGRR